MTPEQTKILIILASTVALFLWGRWRHDIVALAALLASVLAGLVPGAQAFAGFGHPAVITVACVLVLSRGLVRTGAVDAMARRVVPRGAGPMVTIAALATLGAALSAFMNNVGAMALLMPVAVQLAARKDLPPGKILMPLAFGTILGGMTTLIGTPPNLIVSAFRAESGSGSFGMFDFTPVGAAVAGLGIAFVSLIGWRLVPAREPAGAQGFDTGTYLTEVRVAAGGTADGKAVHEIESTLDEADAQVIGMVRNEFRIFAPNPARTLRGGDILVIEAEPASLAAVLSRLGLELEEAASGTPAGDDNGSPAVATGDDADRQEESSQTAEIVLQELVALPTSELLGRSATDVQLRTRYGLNLLAISRQGRRSIKRLRSTAIKAGDVLLIQGPAAALAGFASRFGCVPLAERAVHIHDTRKQWLAVGIMAAAVAGAAFGLLPAAVSFAAAVVGFMVFRIVPPTRVYQAIDWPVIVLLGALIPVAAAMAATGAADLLASALLEDVARGRPIMVLALILILTMTLSDFMNNAATAAVMCPVAISAAAQLDASPDAFLMAVAVGASCAFLTPIGHQNNTLILGPGGFRFGDYWRLGLPIEILVVAVSVPMLLFVWPL